jgi:two-component system nitrate/nitrite response regulator NarL
MKPSDTSVFAGGRLNLSIVTDSPLLREGLLTVLPQHISFFLVGAYVGGKSVSAELPNPPNHVILLDMSIGAENALLRTREWHSRSAWVVILELVEDIELIVRCIEAGANAYTLKGDTIAVLAETIERVRQGLVTCSPQVTARLFDYLAHAHHPAGDTVKGVLTGRELEVLALLSQSYTNQQIAHQLFIEVCTVKHHVHNILDKLHVRYRWEAVQVAQRHGWLAETALHQPLN